MKTLRFEELAEKARAFQESRTLLTAVELDLFSAVGEGAPAEKVARRLKTDPRATEMLLNALAGMGALLKRGGVFFNTPETKRYLCKGSPDNQRMALMHAVRLWDRWSTLTECVRKGTAVGLDQPAEQGELWLKAFIAAMHSNASARARDVIRAVGARGIRRMLDVGGGSGAYSIAFAKANPELKAVVLDRPAVLPIARKHIREAGLANRVRTRAGDLTKDEFGSGYDLVLLSAVCHMLSPEENLDLLKRCSRALVPGGRVAIREFILSEDKTRPPRAALFSLNMLVNTKAGASYSEEEYRQWLEAAGFQAVRRTGPEDPGSGLMIGEKARA